MIYDCFTFFNELDLLELRLRELDSLVDRFVIVEAPITFSGNPKPLYFAENKDRFSSWKDVITHIVAGGMDGEMSAWDRENIQRETIRKGLSSVQDHDIIFLTDADEIPSASTILRIFHPDMPRRLSMQMRAYHFYFNYRYRWDMFFPKLIRGDVVMSGEPFRDIRFDRILQDAVLSDCGWHFSSMGGVENAKLKLRSTSHFDHPDAAETLEKYESIPLELCEGDMLTRVPIESLAHPEGIVDRRRWWTERGFIKL